MRTSHLGTNSCQPETKRRSQYAKRQQRPRLRGTDSPAKKPVKKSSGKPTAKQGKRSSPGVLKKAKKALKAVLVGAVAGAAKGAVTGAAEAASEAAGIGQKGTAEGSLPEQKDKIRK